MEEEKNFFDPDSEAGLTSLSMVGDVLIGLG